MDWDTLRRYRVQRAVEMMKKQDLDAILACRVENMRYLTGHRPLWWPSSLNVTRNAAIISKNGEVTAFISSGDLDRAKKVITWLPRDCLQPLAALESPGIIETVVNKQFVPVLKKMGSDKGRIGLDASTFMLMTSFQKALPNAKIVDGDQALSEAKVIKNSEEIKCMRNAALGVDVGLHAAIKTIDVSKRECEVLGEAMKAMYTIGMEIPQANQIVASGGHTSPLHRFASDKIINHGEFVFMDLGGCFNGYFSDATRTVIFGKPTDDQKDIYRAVYGMIQEIERSLKPGITNVELDEKVRGTLKGTKFEKHSYFGVLGHSIGIGPFESPVVGDPAATGEKVFKFEPGMIFSFEPGVFVDAVGGVRLENQYLVTATGTESLERTPYDERLLS
jgi:Xaa-Pro aminopeptidase